MSYLNSLLSSIEGGDKKPASPGTQEPPRTMSPREATNGALTGSSAAKSAAPAKRKAEGDGGSVANKAARKDPSSTAARPAPKPLSKITTTPAGYQGSARPSSAGPLSAKNKASAPQPPPSAPLSAASSAPPKKGSFAEIMARAKAAQESAQPAIGIKHKPVEKLSRKERLLKAQEETKRKRQEGKVTRPGQARRSKSPEKLKGAPGAMQKPKRVPTDLGYKGTMRPSATPSTYTGTMRPGGSASGTAARPPAKPKEKVRMAGYASYSEHSDNDMHSDDWDDDDMSDMEAGISDVEEEEMLSLRAAKREDDQALREENELKRRKAENMKLASRR